MIKKIKQIFKPSSPIYPLLLGMISFFAVIISLFTLNEMKVQRELTITPMVFAKDFKSKLIFADTICKQNYLSNNIVLNDKKEEKEGKLSEWWHIEFINVGQGSAVDIKAEWKLNYKFFENFLKVNKIDEKIFSIKLDKTNCTYKVSSCGSSGASRFAISNDHSYSHLLTASNNKEGLSIPIPSQILTFSVACARALWDKQGQTEENVQLISVKHKLNLTHKSVNGNQFRNQYEIKIDVGPTTYSIMDDGKTVNASWNEFGVGINIELIE